MEINVVNISNLKETLFELLKKYVPAEDASSRYCAVWFEVKQFMDNIPDENIFEIEFLTTEKGTDKDIFNDICYYLDRCSRECNNKNNIYNDLSKVLKS